jgi:hypothetical protein
MEPFFIKEYNSYTGIKNSNGYNLTLGGEGLLGYVFPEDRKNEYAEMFTGINNPMFGKESGFKNKNHSKEFINKLKSKVGKEHHNYGKDFQSKEYIITYPDGTEETITNISKFCKENKLSISPFYTCMNENRDYKGFKFRKSEKTIKMESSPKYIAYDMDKNKYEVFNLKEFCKEKGLYYQCMIRIVGGSRVQHKGWTIEKVIV